MSAAWPLQRALHAALLADPGVSALVGGRVFDRVPRPAPGTAAPYLLIGEASASDRSCTAVAGEEHTLQVTAVSRAAGHGEAKRLLAAVAAALEAHPPAPDGHALVALFVRETRFETARDGRTTLGRMRLRAVTERL